ncbi:hypothetical protein HDF16_002978 [Granulicella aggregans]|uniref:Uncharacterized protein n=1 Tax=Granulicella aggregans TaxID=474949 RepID=A0A7W8E4F8_9BACT|nr:hypothetical protein [Granulicella aggregans]
MWGTLSSVTGLRGQDVAFRAAPGCTFSAIPVLRFVN